MSDPSAPHLTLQQVADELGVHYMTAYRYVRLGMLPAEREGRSWVVQRSDLDEFQSPAQVRPERGTTRWDSRLISRLLAADDSGAWSVVEAAMASGLPPTDVYRSMLVPALREVGERWQSGEIDVAQEHAASQIAGRLIARLGPMMMSRGVRRGTIVVGSTATERHDLPLMIISDLLRSERFEVINLGANLPPESFASAVARSDDVVAAAIGVTMPDQGAEVARTVAAIRAVSDVDIIVGGSGMSDEFAGLTGVTATATTSDEAIAAIEALLAAR
jgi:excisionase family DNA binding protein